jgi:hypothetical protein
MTNTCQCKTGFFGLRTCGAPAVGFCGSCGRAICLRHSAPASNPLSRLCINCAQRASDEPDDYTSSTYDQRSTNYVSSTDYSSSTGLPSYNEQDASSFDAPSGSDAVDNFGGAGASDNFSGS